MKRVRKFNVLLLLLAGLLGVCLGGSVALFCLSLSQDASLFSLLGLIIAIVALALAILLPYFVHEREVQIARVNIMLNQFGKEVDFLNENAFLKEMKRRRSAQRIYALHMALPEQVGEMGRKTAFYALVDAVSEAVKSDALMGYTEFGDLLICTQKDEAIVLSWVEKVEKMLAKETDVPPFSLFLGASLSLDDPLRMCNEALAASIKGEETRESCSLYVYEEDTTAESLDLRQELALERLTFAVRNFKGEEGEVSVLEPMLYNAYRGELTGKDLSRILGLWNSRIQLDEVCVERGVRFLKENPEVRNLIIRVSEEGVLSEGFFDHLANVAKEKEVELSRITLSFAAPGLSERKIRQAVRRAKGLDMGIAVYEYGGDAIDPLIKLGVEYVSLKPESLRASADADYLIRILSALKALGLKPLLDKGSLLEEESSLRESEVLRLPKGEEEE